VRSVIIDILS